MEAAKGGVREGLETNHRTGKTLHEPVNLLRFASQAEAAQIVAERTAIETNLASNARSRGQTCQTISRRTAIDQHTLS
jgi:hypothetical protein